MNDIQSRQKAADLYFDMISNYKRWQANGIDRMNCYNRMVSAAIGISEMELSNPFLDITECGKSERESSEPNLETLKPIKTFGVIEQYTQTTTVAQTAAPSAEKTGILSRIFKHEKKVDE